MSLWGVPWSPPSQQALADGWAAVEQAQAAGGATPREAAYIAAVAAFYQDADTVDHRTRTLAYEQAMQQLAADYPDDTEAQIFEASLINDPNRFRSLYGAARAAELAGETEIARSYYETLIALAVNADGERAEIAQAEAFLAE